MRSNLDERAKPQLESVRPQEKLELVRAFLAATKRTAVLPSAVWHPYGFLLLKVGVLYDSISVRLHIWPSEDRIRQVPDWPIHCHPWLMRSRILSGLLTNEMYQVIFSESETPHQLYRVNYCGKGSVLEATGTPVELHLISRVDYSLGDEYEVEGGRFHATSVRPGVFTATVVLTADSADHSPCVVGELGGTRSYHYERPACDRRTLEVLLSELQARLINLSSGVRHATR